MTALNDFPPSGGRTTDDLDAVARTTGAASRSTDGARRQPWRIDISRDRLTPRHVTGS